MRKSILVLGIFLLFPVSAYAALVNINTAGLAALETLPHIGASLAQRIIDYRTQHGPFAAIEGLQKVSGIGSGSNYADIAPLITVGDAGAPDAATTTASAATTTESAAPAAAGGVSTWVPAPAALSVDAGPDQEALVEVPLRFSARVSAKSGAADPGADIRWSFGDGSSGSGRTAEKTYHYPGTYLVQAIASDGATVGRGECLVSVAPARVRVAAVSPAGVTIANDAEERLDLSLWRLSSGVGTFQFPEGTVLLPESSIFFPSAITNLPAALAATLAYPDGVIAAQYAPPIPAAASTTSAADVQPVRAAAGSPISQAAAAPTSPREPAYAVTAVDTPASTEIAAAGAALPASKPSGIPSIVTSPWTLGFLGVLAAAGGAFILL